MSGPLLDLKATRGRLHALAAAELIDGEELERCLRETEMRPAPGSWARYLYWHALIVGVILLAAGMIFFVAANWSALPGIARMGIVGAPMVAATLIGGYLGDSLAGRATSLLGGLLFGPLVAVYGQVYQTGADAWQLFALWTLVLIAYGALVRFVGTWVLALVCLHVAWFTWIDQELGADFYEREGALLVIALAIVDAGVVGVGEWLSRGREREVITHTAAFLGLAVVLPFGVITIFDVSDKLGPEILAGFAVLILGLVAIWLIYRWRRPALGMLAGFATIVTILISSAFGRVLLDELDAELFGVALLGVIVCAQVWGFTRWLLSWRREHTAPEEPGPEGADPAAADQGGGS